jgi:anti-anti-sigma factor
VNCAALPYIDSTGLSFVVALHNTLKDRGGRLALSFVNPRVRKLLELTRLLEVIPVFDDVDSAFAAIN